LFSELNDLKFNVFDDTPYSMSNKNRTVTKEVKIDHQEDIFSLAKKIEFESENYNFTQSP
jgi:hypothetical protein